MKNIILLWLALIGVAYCDQAVFVNPTTGAPTQPASGLLNGNGKLLTGKDLYPEDYGVKFDMLSLYDVVATNSTTITSASASWASGDVGKSVVVYLGSPTNLTATFTTSSTTITVTSTTGVQPGGIVNDEGNILIQAGTTVSSITDSTHLVLSHFPLANGSATTIHYEPIHLVTTISSVTNAHTVVLANSASVTATGLHVVYGTDNSSAGNSLYSAAYALGGANIVCRAPGTALFAGPLLNPTVQNSIISITNNPISLININLHGYSDSPKYYSGYFGGQNANNNGTILYFATAGSGTYPSLISANSDQTLAGTNNLNLVFEDIGFRCPANPTMSAVNARETGGASFDHCSFDVDVVNNCFYTPETLGVPAFLAPDYNGNCLSNFTNVQIYSAGIGVLADENSKFDKCLFTLCGDALGLVRGSATVIASNCTFIGNYHHVAAEGSAGYTTFAGINLQMADSPGNVPGTSSDFYDPSGTMAGNVSVFGTATPPINFTSPLLHVRIEGVSGNRPVDINPPTVYCNANSQLNIEEATSTDAAVINFYDPSFNVGMAAYMSSQYSQAVVKAGSGYGLYLVSNSGIGIIVASSGAVQVSGPSLSTPIIVGSGTAPTVAAGTGAGTSSTITFSTGSTNTNGDITITTGTSPAASAAVATITNASSYAAPHHMSVSLTPENAAAAALFTTSTPYCPQGGTTTWTINSNTTALVTATTYIFHYNATAN